MSFLRVWPWKLAPSSPSLPSLGRKRAPFVQFPKRHHQRLVRDQRTVLHPVVHRRGVGRGNIGHIAEIRRDVVGMQGVADCDHCAGVKAARLQHVPQRHDAALRRPNASAWESRIWDTALINSAAAFS